MRARGTLKRRAFFVEDQMLERAKKALGVKTKAEVIRLSVERVVEMDEFGRFMKKSRRIIQPNSFDTP